MFVIHISMKNSFEHVFGLSPKYNIKSTYLFIGSILLTMFCLNCGAISHHDDIIFTNYMITSIFMWLFMIVSPFYLMGLSLIKWPFDFIMMIGLLIEIIYGICIFSDEKQYLIKSIGFVISLMDFILSTIVYFWMFFAKIYQYKGQKNILDITVRGITVDVNNPIHGDSTNTIESIEKGEFKESSNTQDGMCTKTYYPVFGYGVEYVTELFDGNSNCHSNDFDDSIVHL